MLTESKHHSNTAARHRLNWPSDFRGEQNCTTLGEVDELLSSTKVAGPLHQRGVKSKFPKGKHVVRIFSPYGRESNPRPEK